MQVFHVYIDEVRFTFVDRAPVDEFKERVVQACRVDGAFVPITHSSRPPTEVLVTRSTRVRIEAATIPREAPGPGSEGEGDDAFWFDFDTLG